MTTLDIHRIKCKWPDIILTDGTYLSKQHYIEANLSDIIKAYPNFDIGSIEKTGVILHNSKTNKRYSFYYTHIFEDEILKCTCTSMRPDDRILNSKIHTNTEGPFLQLFAINHI